MKRRNTPAKQAILQVLGSAKTALSQEAIEQLVQGSMDRVTVYRVLNSFCADGYAHRIVSDDGKAYFALCRNCTEGKHQHNHFHFRCSKCHQVECLQEEVAVKMPPGYTLETTNCLLTGHCPACS